MDFTKKIDHGNTNVDNSRKLHYTNCQRHVLREFQNKKLHKAIYG